MFAVFQKTNTPLHRNLRTNCSVLLDAEQNVPYNLSKLFYKAFLMAINYQHYSTKRRRRFIMKKFVAILLSVATCVLAIVFLTACEKASKELSYVLTVDGEAYICTGVGMCEDIDIVIPDKHKGKPVVEIGDCAFQNNLYIRSLTFGDNIVAVGKDNLVGCDNIESVVIGNGLEDVSGFSFYNLEKLKNVTLGDNVAKIDKRAFYGCGVHFTEYEGMQYLGCSGNPYFALMSRLEETRREYTTFKINENCKIIGAWAFDSCYKLETLEIPDGVRSIGEYAFYGCSALKKVSVPDSITYIGRNFMDAYGNVNYEIFSEYCDGCYIGNEKNPYLALVLVKDDGGDDYRINDNCKLIGRSAFENCKRLTSITIPDSVQSINDYAFYGDESLVSVTIGKGVAQIGSNLFEGCKLLRSLNYNGKMKDWNKISKNRDWKKGKEELSDGNFKISTIKCSDGELYV